MNSALNADDTKNIGIITQVRLSSSRLPQKVLLPLADDTLLGHHLKRLQKTGIPTYAAVAMEPGHEAILAECEKNQTPSHVGSVDDVLDRFYQTAKYFKLDVIIRVTSDCPLIDPTWITKGCAKLPSHFKSPFYISNVIERTLPRGFDFEIFSMESLSRAWKKDTTKEQREHVTPSLRDAKNTQQFTHITHTKDYSDWRLCVDETLDYDLIKILTEKHKAHQMDGAELLQLLDDNSELKKINASIQQKRS